MRAFLLSILPLHGKTQFQTVVLLLAYTVAGIATLNLYAIDTYAAPLWPSAGIALAALLLYGYRLWPGIFVGAFFVNLFIGAHPLLALAIAIGNTLEAVFGTFLLYRVADLDKSLERAVDVLSLVTFGSIATAVSATVGAFSLLAFQAIPAEHFASVWGTWWLGDALGILLFSPFILTWFSAQRLTYRFAESAGIALSFIALSLLLFSGIFEGAQSTPLMYLYALPLAWGALRFGPHATTILILSIAVVVTTGVLISAGPFASIPVAESMLFLQIFLATLSTMFLLLTAIAEERKRAVYALREHIDKLEQAFQKIRSADQAKNDFLAILAHELRNPLAPIMSSLELIKLRPRDPEVTELTDIMDKHMGNIRRLLDDLLDISRISRKKFKLQKETVELRSIVSRAEEMVSPFVKSRRHSFIVEIPEESVWLEADPLRLEQILINLLNNASKYTDPGGQIRLTCTKEGDSVCMVVKDSGIGIPSHMLQKVFEPFLQIHENARGSGGLGIGLSLTKKLVELHDGEIEVRSDGPGKGSEFTVRFPLPPLVQLQIPTRKKKHVPASQHLLTDTPVALEAAEHRILVVDDNEAAARGLGKLLKHKGYEVELAFDGPGALEAEARFHPHTIVLDIGLPGFDGYEVARRLLKHKPKNFTLIALTGYGQEHDKQRALQAGFDHHLTKPVSVADIEALAPLSRAAIASTLLSKGTHG